MLLGINWWYVRDLETWAVLVGKGTYVWTPGRKLIPIASLLKKFFNVLKFSVSKYSCRNIFCHVPRRRLSSSTHFRTPSLCCFHHTTPTASFFYGLYVCPCSLDSNFTISSVILQVIGLSLLEGELGTSLANWTQLTFLHFDKTRRNTVREMTHVLGAVWEAEHELTLVGICRRVPGCLDKSDEVGLTFMSLYNIQIKRGGTF